MFCFLRQAVHTAPPIEESVSWHWGGQGGTEICNLIFFYRTKEFLMFLYLQMRIKRVCNRLALLSENKPSATEIVLLSSPLLKKIFRSCLLPREERQEGGG